MDKQLWLIKDKKGRIFGPYSEEEICFYIEEGEFKGEELFSSYPPGKWQPLSAHSVFYEKILERINKVSISRKSKDKSPPESEASKEESQSLTEDSEEEEVTRIVTPRELSSSSKKKSKVTIKLSEDFKEEVLMEEGVLDDVIEMEKVKSQFIKDLWPALKFPLLIFTALLLVFSFVFLNSGKRDSSEEHLHLMSLGSPRPPWSVAEIRGKVKMGLQSYYRGTTSHYLNAQKQFLQVLEGNPDSKEIYLYLCMTYLELWPFAWQDSHDKEVLKSIVNISSTKDPGGIYSGVCRSVKALIDNKPDHSLMITNSSLNIVGDLNLIYFYYLKAKALKVLGQDSEARFYVKSIYNLQPKWIAPYMLSAQMFYKKGQYDLAAKLYQKVISIFPEHPSAGLRLGVLEYKYFKKAGKSENRLKSILMNLNDLVEPDILIEAYITLAAIYFQKNDEKEMLKYSNKAYALEPDHPDLLLLKSQMGDRANFESVQIQARGLIYKGDVLVSQGKCSEAKKYFKQAYESGKKRNAQAALRMAQCFWQSGASGQAIRWLKRAIRAEDRMMEAYFLLSDYLSSLYDFESARDVLEAVKSQNPSSYDLFKAYALLAFRQKQYKAAVTYAERSLKFYTSDIDVYILLSKAYLALGQGHKSFFYAEKAVQENVNSVSAQVAYALALDLAYGPHRAKAHFKELIERFPLIIEYQRALGEYYFNKGMYDEALAEFQHIVQKNSKFKPAYVYLGRIYNYLSYKEGGQGENYQEALRAFLEASLLDIVDPEPLFYLGETYMQHQQHQLAENEFEKILQINPNYPMIHYYIGLVNFYQQGEKNLDKALKAARTQSAKNPNHYLPYKLAGDIYKLKSQGAFAQSQKRKNIYELCASEYQKALKHLKNDLEISIRLIECYKGSGNLDSALQLGLQIIKEEGLSGYPEIYKEIASIYEAKEQYEQAQAKYIDYFSLKPGAKDRKEIEARIQRLIKEKQDLSRSQEKK